MFVFNFKEWKIPDISVFKDNISTELLMLNSQISEHLEYKEKIYQSFINLSIQTYLNLTNVTILTEFNKAFTITENILKNLNKLKIKLETIKNFVQNYKFEESTFNRDKFLQELQDFLEEYYSLKNNIQLQTLTKTKELKEILEKLSIYANKPVIASPEAITKENNGFLLIETPTAPLEEVENTDADTQNDIPNLEQDNNNNNDDDDRIVKLSEIEPITQNQNVNKNIDDNRVLIISEKENKVYLPYYISDLEDILEENPNYDSIETIIEDQYIQPLSKYKSSIISRFKEAFKLIRERENGSFRESLALGFELMNNYKIHPAVIAACRNEDELDIYLDCLDENELDSFEFFDIKFEIPPTKIR